MEFEGNISPDIKKERDKPSLSTKRISTGD
jgi:hypothetical protein